MIVNQSLTDETFGSIFQLAKGTETAATNTNFTLFVNVIVFFAMSNQNYKVAISFVYSENVQSSLVGKIVWIFGRCVIWQMDSVMSQVN